MVLTESTQGSLPPPCTVPLLPTLPSQLISPPHARRMGTSESSDISRYASPRTRPYHPLPALSQLMWAPVRYHIYPPLYRIGGQFGYNAIRNTLNG